MTLKEVKEVLNAEVISGDHDLEKEIKCAFAAELLSDVLALSQEGALLITGFTHPQVVYAADAANLCAVLFVRGRWPNEATQQLAIQKKIPLLSTPYMMFETCGLLYEYGLKTCAIKPENGQDGK
jgi:predicted transcriptional regulator